jgi:predicted O-methyltransferase YrrM
MRIAAYMLSCHERALVRRETQERLAATDWAEPAQLVVDPEQHERSQQRQSDNARALLRRAIDNAAEFLLFLEDDLEFNQYLRANLTTWEPLRGTSAGGHFFASLYNPGIRELRREPVRAFLIADPSAVYGSQAFVLSLTTASHIERHWDDVAGMQDIKMSRLAARVGAIYYHVPSLVQHVPVQSVWGGGYHSAGDYQRDWRAAGAENQMQSPGQIDRAAILRHMRAVDGWLDENEANLLITTVAEALERSGQNPAAALVEVGSYCGRSTVVLGSTMKALGPHSARLYAIDPHDGDVSTLEGGVMRTSPTLELFRRNIAGANIEDVVVPLVSRATDVPWKRPIAFLFLDGLHDFASVSADLAHFEPFVCRGGFVAFHDYAYYFSGVVRVVDGLLASGAYSRAHQIGSLVVLEKR